MAQATLIGTLGKDPELKQSRDGRTTFAKFSLAWSERQKDATGNFSDGPTQWIQVTVFGRQAQNVVASLGKGMRVIVTGRLQPEMWQSQQGEQVVMTMTADTVAPELTFASVQVVRNEKGQQQGSGFQGQQPAQQHQGGFSQQQAQGDPWNSAPPAGGFGGDDSEPPF